MHFFLSSIAPKLSVSLSGSAVATSVKRSGAKGSIVGDLSPGLAAPYALESFTDYGIFTESGPTSLLQYYTTASEVSEPNDWFGVQDALANKFEVTLRDPWMSSSEEKVSPSPASSVADGSCPPGTKSEGGYACVVAVVRFEGDLIDAALNVTVFDAGGGTVGTTLCVSGVCNVKVPEDGRCFAAVQYKEMEPGTRDGTDYEYVDHWATTTLNVERADV